MKINEYLKEMGWSRREFARRLDMDPQTIVSVISGRNVRWFVIQKIVEFTKGKVSFKDLIVPRKEKTTKKASDL